MSKIVTVAPLVRGPWSESLTYFSSQKFEVGDLVKAPIGRRQVGALVIESSPVELVRSEIRSANIEFKKIGEVTIAGFVDQELIETAKELAREAVAPLGAVLKRLIPQAIITSYLVDSKSAVPGKVGAQKSANQHSVMAIQDNLPERLSTYRNLIRESFAKKQSVLVSAPTNADLGVLSADLPKGIEEYTVIVDGQKSKVAVRKAWDKARSSKHPLLILTTLVGLGISRNDLGLIIIDGDGKAGTSDLDHPSLSLRQAAVKLAKFKKIRVVLGDDVLSLETVYQTEIGHWSPLLPPLKYRSVSAANQKINPTPDHNRETKEPAILSEETLSDIKQAIEASDRIAILTGRRGFGSVTVCQDCGTSVRCHRCQAPLVVHDGGERQFRCHRCQLSQTIPDRCPACHGWRQTTLGIGIDRVVKLLTKKFPRTPIFVLDSDHTPRRTLVAKTIKTFLATPGSLVIGTEMLTRNLRTPIETTIGVALDSRLSSPDYRATENLFRELITLRSLATKNFIIDTRDPNHPVFDHARKGNILDFVRDELEIRRILKYPPLSLLLKVGGQGNEAKKLIDELERKTQDFSPDKISGTGSHAQHFLVYKKKPGEWPDDKLIAILKTLPPTINITINPESLL